MKEWKVIQFLLKMKWSTFENIVTQILHILTVVKHPLNQLYKNA